MKFRDYLRRNYLLLAIPAAVLAGCNKDNPVPNPNPGGNNNNQIPDSTLAVNQFIHDNMETYYLWYNQMPDIDYTKQRDPYKYFDSLLYKPTDRWSFITNDYAALEASYQGVEKSMGHSFILYKYSNSDGVFGIIQFVYPGSPAAIAGIKRGDLFTAIDGTDLNVNNYQSLLAGQSYTLSLAKLQGNTVVPTHDVQLTAEQINENPILVYDTLNVNGTIIGYLAYKNFLDNYDDSLAVAFNWLKSAGINKMVLDLRYNNGGAISAMQYLASILAPVTHVNNQDIIITDEYNDILTAYFQSQNISNDTRFENVGVNLNLNDIYVLTGENTASASEALIVGLDPYLTMTTLGDTTVGKYAGAYVIYDTTHKLNWAIQPIVFKYANSVGYTDFANGLVPNFLGDDDLFNPLGSRKEGLLALAIQQITGAPVAVTPKSAQIRLGAIPFREYDGNKPRHSIPLVKNDINLLKQINGD